MQFFMKMVILIVTVSAVALFAEPPYMPGLTNFKLHYKDLCTATKITPIFLLPEDQLHLRLEGPTSATRFQIQVQSGLLQTQGRNTWHYQAPKETGIYAGEIISSDADTMQLRVVVMVPKSCMQGEYLNGYRIGEYPAVAWRNLAIYRPPQGFIEVTAENHSLLLTPHFELGQFLCKQAGGFPKYVVLQERLLYKLEFLLGKVNEKGHRCDTFTIMSGYRTPWYNRAIGNGAHSQHCYGGAADIYIDQNPADDIMDDLNGDGRQDFQDAGMLFAFFELLSKSPLFEPFIGGLARYRENERHGPFIHVDVRGYSARW